MPINDYAPISLESWCCLPPQRTAWQLALAAALLLALLLVLSPAQGISGIGVFTVNTTLGFTPVTGITSGEPRVNWINGEYQEADTDLSVKALGGSVDIARSWIQGCLELNPECTTVGDGCCVQSKCKLTAKAFDRFTDPIDLCQNIGLCSGIQEIGGVPFNFGLSCSSKYSVKDCRENCCGS